jgi:hypothetical protein
MEATHQDREAARLPARTRIRLLTAPGCHLCEEARTLIDRLTDGYALDLEVIDLASPEGVEWERRLRPPMPPAIIIDDELFAFGRVSERKLRKRLHKGASR